MIPPQFQPLELDVPLEDLQKNKLFIATPMYGGMCAGMYCKSMFDLGQVCQAAGINVVFSALFNESLITRARNYCVDAFMRSDCTHLLFLDSDLGFNPIDMIALLAMQTDDSPYDIIGAPYPKKCISWEKVKIAVDKGFADNNPEDLHKFVGDYVFNPKQAGEFALKRPVEVLEIGTGCMMVRKKTFEKFIETYPQYWYRPDHVRTKEYDGSRKIMQYFQAEIDTIDREQAYRQGLHKILDNENFDRDKIKDAVLLLEKEIEDLADKKSLRYLSEDYWFCQRVNQMGLSTWICPWMRMDHVGTYVFGGSVADIASLQISPTVDAHLLKK